MSMKTIRDIPVITEHMSGCKGDFEPMDFDYDDDYCSGFPFDNSGRRSRDPLEDIAQRHPEFAQHLQGFPRRSQRAGGTADQPQDQDDEFLRRRFERPFSSGRFERFGFPFDRDDFEREPQRYYNAYPEHFESFQNQNPSTPPHTQTQQTNTPQGYQQHPPRYSQEYNPQSPYSQQQQEAQKHPQYHTQASQSVSQGTQTEDAEVQGAKEQESEKVESEAQVQQKSEGAQTRGRPIQQSNTCDLAQHQSAVDEAQLDEQRAQRSMSAPPTENNTKRFTSSVNIPMGGHQESGSGGNPQSQAAGSGSTERVIPIHVEGRDDPVMPKNFSGGPAPTQTQHQPQPERIFSDSPRSQPETIFGRRPEAFTQFVHRDSPHRFANDWPHHSFGGFPEDEFGFRRSESPNRFAGAQQQARTPPQRQQEQPFRQEFTQNQQQSQQAPRPQPQPQQQEAPKPQPQKQPQGPIEQIQAIQKDVSSLLRQVESFNGKPKDKNYLYLDEMLTRNLLRLDNIDTQGQDSIRSARKEAIKCIEKGIGLLESRAAANVAPKEENMEVEQNKEVEKMDTEGSNSQEASTMEMSPKPSQESEGEQQQPKSDEVVESAEGQVNKEEAVKGSEEDAQNTQQVDVKTSETSEGGESTTEVKEADKKEKKKIKKKINKEDKEKNTQ